MLRSIISGVNKAAFSSSFKNAQKSLLGTSSADQSSHSGFQKYDEKLPEVNITKLPNGIRVITESTTIPSTVQLGLYIDVGARDETP